MAEHQAKMGWYAIVRIHIHDIFAYYCVGGLYVWRLWHIIVVWNDLK